MLSVIVSTFALISSASAQNAPAIPAPYVTPFEFCSKLPDGQYCDAQFPRSYYSCPSGIQRFCLPNQVCQPKSGVDGEVECAFNFFSPITKLCFDKPKETSYCMDNNIVECSLGTKYCFNFLI